eukprot:10368355-Alexandrium_andersonii.AAC.1
MALPAKQTYVDTRIETQTSNGKYAVKFQLSRTVNLPEYYALYRRHLCSIGIAWKITITDCILRSWTLVER